MMAVSLLRGDGGAACGRNLAGCARRTYKRLTGNNLSIDETGMNLAQLLLIAVIYQGLTRLQFWRIGHAGNPL